MELFQKARNKAFWISDRLKRSEIRRNVEDITAMLNNQWSPASVRRRDQLLRQLLEHAKHTTPYYHNLKVSDAINDFPVVNKNIIRNNHSSFRSATFSEKNTIKISTSGSTGTPLIIFQNKDKRIRNTADTIYFAGRAGFNIGNKLFYMRLWDKHLKKSPVAALMQNMKMVNVADLSDEYFDRLIRSWQQDKSKKGLLGYVSAYTQLCKYLDKIEAQPMNCNINSIIAVAESLSSYCKLSMEKYFKRPVLSRYSNMENGILAQQFFDSDSSYQINWASYSLEILDLENDVPVENGVLGRIVITDLFNYAMPLIRYDTGDLGFVDLDENGVPLLKGVQGRKMDMIYDTRGRMITPSVVWELEFYKNIKQFQLIQNGIKSFTFKLNVEGDFDAEAELIQRFNNYFGHDAVITIEKTNEIPVLASGKRRLVVNNCYPT